MARRQEAERALLQRERELADFVENAAEGLHRVGPDGTILWANKAELQMLGYSWDEYVGRHIAEFHVDGDVIDCILSTLLSGGTLIDQPARLRCKDGSIRHVLIHSNGSFEDGKLRYTRCFTRDATERRQRDEALAQRDRMLLNAPVVAALLVGPAFTFRLANRRYVELAGRGALDGKAYAEVFPELGGTEAMRMLEQVYRTGQACGAEELRVELARPDGVLEERFLQYNLKPFTTAPGEEQGVIVVAVDVTDKVRNRRSLERAHAERERLFEELTLANRTKDEFLAMLGHELRNPLSPIVTALQLMRMRGETGAVREREIIERQVEHLVRLVDDLMDVARATRGQIELKAERGDIAVPLAKAVEMASPLLEQRSHRLAVEVEQDMQWKATRCAWRRSSRTCSRMPRATPRTAAPSPCPRAATALAGCASACAITASAWRPRCCPRCSACSSRASAASTASRAASVSAWRWSRTSSSCTAARSRPTAPAWGRAANSSCACRCTRWRWPACRSPRWRRGRRRGGASWSSTTTSMRPRRSACCCRCTGTRSRCSTIRSAHWPRRRACCRTSRCSTSACRCSTALSWPCACARRSAITPAA